VTVGTGAGVVGVSGGVVTSGTDGSVGVTGGGSAGGGAAGGCVGCGAGAGGGCSAVVGARV
jgi:hypothetical protein